MERNPLRRLREHALRACFPALMLLGLVWLTGVRTAGAAPVMDSRSAPVASAAGHRLSQAPGDEVVNPANIATLPAGANVLLDFNNFPAPSDGQAVPANYAGCTWTSLVQGSPWAGLSTWNFYIANGGAQGTVTCPRPVIVRSVRVSSGSSNTFTLTSAGNPNVSLTTANGNPQTLTTVWTAATTSFTVRSSTTDQALDDLRFTVQSAGAPTATSTSAPPTSGPTATRTNTPAPPTATPVAPTATRTNTPAPPTSTPAAPTPPPSGAIVADHTVLGQFAQIPQSAIAAAAARRSLFMHQSTGGYIDDQGLGCLAGLHGDPTNYPQECVTYANNRATGAWPWYDKTNLTWDPWPQPQADAIAKTDQWVSVANARASGYDVLGMKYCYTDGWNQGQNVAQNYYINKMLALESQYPGKTFIWATSALWADPGTACNTTFNSCQQIAEFNEQVRAYARAHNKPLFDVAAIESHDANGQPCTVRDQAGQPWEGMCSQWYSDGGGHPKAEASIRLAKGYWWLMARISGWNGN